MINRYYKNDILTFLSNVPKNCINNFITDPPYLIKYNGYLWDNKEKINWTWDDLCNEFYRILDKNGQVIIMAGWSNVLDVKEAFEKKFQLNNWIAWDRIKGRGAKRNLVSTREDILWFSKNDKYIFHPLFSNTKKKTKGFGSKNGSEYRRLTNVWSDISPVAPMSKEYVDYPCQKPLVLGNRFINLWTNENDIIIDPFMGSGTFLVSANNLNRKYIGNDFNQEAIDKTKTRLKRGY